ncbi:MAG: hypothetical protein ACJ786_14030 [Catenulispora sp.]
MANPEMPGAQQQDLGAVLPRERPDPIAASGASFGEHGDERARRRPAESESPAERRPAEPARSGLPLLARVLLADLGVVIVALIALTVVEVQRLGGEATLHLRRQAYAEDLAVLFLVAAVFGVVAYLLLRAGRSKVAIVQAVVTALVLTVAITSAVAGNPKPSQVTPIERDQ